MTTSEETRVFQLHQWIMATGGTYTLYHDRSRHVWRASLVRSGINTAVGRGHSAMEAVDELVLSLEEGARK